VLSVSVVDLAGLRWQNYQRALAIESSLTSLVEQTANRDKSYARDDIGIFVSETITQRDAEKKTAAREELFKPYMSSPENVEGEYFIYGNPGTDF
jgi:hypothetical protein